MALFKIFKGNETSKLTDANATGYRVPTDGYAYYDTSSNLFYIDAAYGNDNTITREPINANISNQAMNGVFYGTCDTAASTKAKVATLVNGDGFNLAPGVMIAIKFTYASASSTMTLSVDDSPAKSLMLYGTSAMSSTTSTNGWPAGAVVPFVYNGTNWVRFYWSNTTYYYTSAYCTTGAATAAKVGSSSATQTLIGSRYFQLWIQNTNTHAGALTLNMNSLGAKPIYINGTPSSSTNYNLLRGCYIVYYDADGNDGNGCYHFRTDNKLPGDLAGNADTATYATTAGSAESVAWADISGAPGYATNTTGGLLTDAQAVKLAGISTSAEVNQNAFGKVAISGQTTIEADAKIDTLNLAGSNVTLTTTPDSDTVTIGITSEDVIAALGYTPFSTKPSYSLNEITDTDDLQAIEGLSGTSGLLRKTAANTWSLDTNNYITGMFIASYGSSTYADVLAAYKANKVVYCRASSNSNPGSGSQNRMAFLAYVNNSTTPTEFEFQYYRSVATHSNSQQGDQVFVYKLNSSGTWSVTTREAYTKIAAGTNMSSSYSSGTLTLTAADPTVKQTAKTDNVAYKILMGANSSPTSGTAYEAVYDANITINPSTHTITATNFAGNASTATDFASNKTIALTGNVTGSASGGAGSGWSIATTIANNTVTNDMLVGSIGNSKLVHSSIGVAGNTISLGDSVDAATLRTSLGLSNAMHFIGVATVAITDGSTTDPVITNYTFGTNGASATAGDVIIDKDTAYEYVWTTAGKWERLGGDSSYKTVQSAVTTWNSSSDTTTTFVSGVTQNENGVITVTKQSIPTYNNYSLPTASSSTKGGIKVGTGLTMSGEVMNHSNSVTAQTTQALYPIKIDAQGHISAYGDAITQLPASDVSAWAKAANKPSYTFSEITSKPTTIGGYGITDAKIASGTITLGSNSITPLTASSTLDATKLSGTIPTSCYTNTTYGLANYNTSGLAKPWYSHTSASTGPTAGTDATAVAVNAISTTSGRYYGVEMDSVGRMFVNIPWTNVNSSYLTTHQSVTNNNIDVTWNTETTIATIGSTPIKIRIPANPNTNYYHKTGSWNGLTYTAAKVGSPGDLAFTIPTGTSATTVAIGNHTHTTSIATSTSNNQVTLAFGTKYALSAGGTSYVFTMPSNPNTDGNQNVVLATTSKAYLTGVTTTPTSTAQALTAVADTGVYLTTTAGEISAVRHSFNVSGTEKAYMVFNSTTDAIDFIFN